MAMSPAEFDRELANRIWWMINGKAIPDHYTDEDCKAIVKRYWHRAMEQGNG